jgi:HSP20 family molecular chaperone IbpA
MQRKAIKKTDSSVIYPGTYKAAGINRKPLLTKASPGVQKIRTSTNVVESADDITIQLAAPGFCREDFVVTVNNCNLAIYAWHHGQLANELPGNTQREIDYYFNRRLQLPANIDPDFVSAEYKDGILCLRFLRSSQACGSKRHHVAVY